MNTVEKGNVFESRSLSLIKQLIQDGIIGPPKEYLKIFEKKKYPSGLRKGDITFDLTIEFWPPGADRCMILYVIECKNYQERVSVNKIETFHSQLVQLQAFNVKGIFITNSPLQEGGYNIADSANIMVIQGELENDYQIILYKSTQKNGISEIPFLKDKHVPELLDKDGEMIAKMVDQKILEAFKRSISDAHISYGIDKLSKQQIEKEANDILNRIEPRVLSEGYILNSKLVREAISRHFGFKVIGFPSNSEKLGYCDLKNQEIGITADIIGTDRELFLLAHELGHLVLHSKLRIGQISYELFQESKYNFKTDRHDLKNPRHWIEWQANFFAASLIFPRILMKPKIYYCQQFVDQPQGDIYIDDQPQNRAAYFKLVKKMAYVYNTTQTTVSYRLNELDLVKNNSRLRSIGEIIGTEFKDLFI